MNLFDLLDRPIAFHRPLVTIAGSVHGGLMLSQAIYWAKRTDDKAGWFYKSQDEWKAETGLSRREQDSARKHLLACGCWEERYERLNHRMWYRVISPVLSAMLKSAIGECRKAPVPNNEIGHSCNSSKTTTETTTPPALFPLPEKTRKSKEGTVNGAKPTQAMIEDFCVSLQLTRLDGELMLLKWQADGWPKNWMDKIRYWKRGGYMPSQKHKQGDRRAPAKVEVDPPGWSEYLKTLEPFFQERARGRTFHQCPEDMQITFRRFRKAQKEAQNHGTH